jgi:3-deoxy-D-manno-octulosonic-acid transferase
LRAIFALADIAFIGGSIAPHGGHNVLEPAAQGVCVVTGPHTQNFAAIVDGLRRENAIVQLPDVSDAEAPRVLATTITQLLTDDSLRTELGRRAQLVCERNTGATARAIAEVAKLLETHPTAAPVPFSTMSVSAAK